MPSKRFKKLPEKTKDLKSELLEKLLPGVKEKGNLTLKGDLIKNTFITSSMGVSYKVKLGKVI